MYRFLVHRGARLINIIHVDDDDIERKSDTDIGLKQHLIRVTDDKPIKYGTYLIEHVKDYSYRIIGKRS